MSDETDVLTRAASVNYATGDYCRTLLAEALRAIVGPFHQRCAVQRVAALEWAEAARTEQASGPRPVELNRNERPWLTGR